MFTYSESTVVSGAVNKNAPTAGCGRKDVEAAVAKWLTGSHDRDGARMQRSQRERQRHSAPAVNSV